MLRQYELVEKVKAYDPGADEDLLNRAYVFSMRAHGTQVRASGDPYFSHPIEVAGILTDLKLDGETIATGILHDTIEDTVATQDEIERLFGRNVARLVDGVTKLSRIEAQTESERAAENFRKFLLAMSDDIRVLLVKLADRLHNMRTLHFIKNPDKRRRIAKETAEIYAPLAERIGMYEFKDELAEIAFRELEPLAFESITRRLEQLRESAGDLIPLATADLQGLLESNHIRAAVVGREKTPYSIWKKMQEHHVGFEQLSDIMAFRIIVDSIPDVYQVLGLIHQRWPMVPGRFKDYISTPKRNGYRSLHTTVIGPAKRRVEIQIRTHEMHGQAEYGLAAHWAYKTNTTANPGENYPWLQDLLEILDHDSGAEEFLEHTKLAMYQDQVFCFTPKGELIQLPKGSTPVDFAFAVHTRLGETTVGAKVNGRLVPLRNRLENGDQVEILRSTAQRPEPGWAAFVVTGKARSAVRRFTRQQERETALATGRSLLRMLIERLDVALAPGAIEAALPRLKLPDEDALCLALAHRTIGEDDVVEAIIPGSTLDPTRAIAKTPAARSPLAACISGGKPEQGLRLATCCHPVPGDRLVGIIDPDDAITVHAVDCPVLAAAPLEHWVDLHWQDKRPDVLFVARLRLTLLNRPGALATAVTVISKLDAVMVAMSLEERDDHIATLLCEIEVVDLVHLTKVLAALRATQMVSAVERSRSAA